MKKLEEELFVSNKEVLTLKEYREKTAHALAELQTSISTKNQELTKANDIIADHKLKLTTLEKTLEGAKERERILSKDLQIEKDFLESAANTFNAYKDTMKLCTNRLVAIADGITV